MNCLQKKPHISMRFLVVAYSDKTIESIVDEMDKFSALFESTKKPQEWAWGYWFNSLLIQTIFRTFYLMIIEVFEVY